MKYFSSVIRILFAASVLKSFSQGKVHHKKEYRVEHEQQEFLLKEAKLRCDEIANVTRFFVSQNKTHCPPVWDGVLCWPGYYAGGMMASQPCPNYIDKFLKNGKAYKFCTQDGVWFSKITKNISRPWTDFSLCIQKTESSSAIFAIRVISNIGFIVSIASVITAIAILRIFKHLHCDRNTIHINLFIACLLRSLSSLMSQLQNNNETNAYCKFVMLLHNYLVMANFTWVFVEALYLHNVLTVHTFEETSGYIYRYILLGWGLPLVAILIWMAIRLLFDNTYCWDNGDHKARPDLWILLLYPTLLLVQNLVFFVKLAIILYTKMANQQLTATENKFKKLGKSIIVLMVVFGLYQLVFIPLDFIEGMYNDSLPFQMKFYFEYLLNSVQGFMLSMMFCFCNSEVLNEMKRKFHNRRSCRSLRLSEAERPRENSTRRRRKCRDSLVTSDCSRVILLTPKIEVTSDTDHEEQCETVTVQ